MAIFLDYFLVEVYNGDRQIDILLDLDNHR